MNTLSRGRRTQRDEPLGDERRLGWVYLMSSELNGGLLVQ